jgi:hypothetical protein
MLSGTVHVVRQHAAVSPYSGWQAARVAVTTAVRLRRRPTPTVAETVPAEASAFGMSAPAHAARDHREAQQGDQRGPQRSQVEGAIR